ncbi:DegV family protein [bacterium]|nr:DegV family protein [bacterium]
MISIITDSTCDIPEDLLEAYGIIVIPQTIIWGDEQFHDRVDLQPTEFYRRVVQDDVYPQSSLPTMREILDAFDKAIIQGAKHIIMLTVSSAMSGTYGLAKNAAQQAKVPVTVIDSKGPSMTLGWQVLAAVRARNEGFGLEEILARIEQARQKMAQFVAMESIEYLRKGGRIGRATSWAGIILKVKPLISINHETGLVEPVSLYRTRKSLVNALYKKFFEQFKGKKKLHIAVLHGDVLDQAEALAKRVRDEFNPMELLVNITGPVLGINTGPEALALCGYSED